MYNSLFIIFTFSRKKGGTIIGETKYKTKYSKNSINIIAINNINNSDEKNNNKT